MYTMNFSVRLRLQTRHKGNQGQEGLEVQPQHGGNRSARDTISPTRCNQTSCVSHSPPFCRTPCEGRLAVGMPVRGDLKGAYLSACCRQSWRQREWKVETQSSLAALLPPSTTRCTRSLISAAAAVVNVIARIWAAGTPCKGTQKQCGGPIVAQGKNCHSQNLVCPHSQPGHTLPG